jgi:hypothetical protein
MPPNPASSLISLPQAIVQFFSVVPNHLRIQIFSLLGNAQTSPIQVIGEIKSEASDSTFAFQASEGLRGRSKLRPVLSRKANFKSQIPHKKPRTIVGVG